MGYRIVRGDLQQDKRRLLSYWNSFHAQTLDEKFQWLYENNVDDVAMFWLLEHEESGEIVGASALFPRKFIVRGETLNAGIAGDLFVSPNHRTLGPAIMLQKAVVKGAQESGMAFVLAFSNKYAELIDKRIGYKKVGHLVRLVGMVRSARALCKLGLPLWLARSTAPVVDLLLWCRFALGARGSDGRIKEVSAVDGGYEQLWHECSSGLDFAGERSCRYMNWKYGQDPDDDNGFMLSESSTGRVDGCIVYRRDGDAYEIRDLLPGPETKTGRRLLNRFFLKVRAEGVDSVVVNPLGVTELARHFLKAGFVQSHKGRAVMMHANSELGAHVLPLLQRGEGVLLLKSDEDS